MNFRACGLVHEEHCMESCVNITHILGNATQLAAAYGGFHLTRERRKQNP